MPTKCFQLPAQPLFLIQRLPVTLDSDDDNDESKKRYLPKLETDIDEAVPFQQNAPNNAQKMSERESFPDDLRPVWHPTKRKHESGEQDRWEKNKESHLYGL